MAKASGTIIIKKKKAGHAGAHGGSWKVAYADFVTAMMAFFLLMWLISMTPQDKKKALSEYFVEFSLFQQGSKSILSGEGGGEGMLGHPAPISAEPAPEVRAPASDQEVRDRKTPEQLQAEIKGAIKDRLPDLKDAVNVERVRGGLRVDLQSPDGAPTFDSGSNQLTEAGRRALSVLGAQLYGLPNQITIEGHTDAKPFAKGSSGDNWELSTNRAVTAMRQLAKTGLDQKKLARVAGFADTQPLVKDDPLDPKNRRISIYIADLPPEEKPKEEGEGIIPPVNATGVPTFGVQAPEEKPQDIPRPGGGSPRR